ncbi:10584_t:CDS:1, partial [Scutellospora calospora]
YEIYLNTQWEGGYNYDVKQKLRTFLQRNCITYLSFLKYCKYSKKDFRKFMIVENNIGVCRK